jgi:outer membrane receptor protein involved in Fe transport
LNAAYNHAYSTVAVPAIGARAGDTLPFSPRVTAAALTDYTFPISDQMNGDLGATFSYQGYRPTAFSEDELNPISRLPGYGTLNLRLGTTWGDYSLQLRVDNVTDKYAYSTSSVMNLFPGQGVPAESVVITPRTYGVEISGKW